MVKGPVGGIDGDQQGGSVHVPLLLCDGPAEGAWATFVFAHGAGAPMDSAFMDEIAQGLSRRGVRVVRFEFPYMASMRVGGVRRPPDSQGKLLDSWRQVYGSLRQQVTGPLVIGGKSMGGRMASLLADEMGAAALVCLGYPFHPAGRPEKTRVEHLAELCTPTLIVQGERDALGSRQEVAGYRLAPTIELCWLEAGDHDLRPLKRSGFDHSGHLQRAVEAVASFLERKLATPPGQAAINSRST